MLNKKDIVVGNTIILDLNSQWVYEDSYDVTNDDRVATIIEVENINYFIVEHKISGKRSRGNYNIPSQILLWSQYEEPLPLKSYNRLRFLGE